MKNNPFEVLDQKLDEINLKLQKILSNPKEDFANKRYTVKQAAEILGVVPLTIRNQIKKGNVEAIRFGRKIYISHIELHNSLKGVDTSNKQLSA